jgi:hypothetical protein
MLGPQSEHWACNDGVAIKAHAAIAAENVNTFRIMILIPVLMIYVLS